MARKDKKGVLGGRVDERNTVESAPVTSSGTSQKDSPLAGYQWKPGESGNPKGRPPTSDLKAEVRAFADEEDPKLRKTRLRQWLEMADRRIRQGSPKHLEIVLGYGWGRPSQSVELDANVNYGDVLDKARKRLHEHERQKLAALTPEERQTLDALNSKMGKALLPAAAATNGHTDPATAKLAAAMPDDAEQPSAPQPAIRPIIKQERWQ